MERNGTRIAANSSQIYRVMTAVASILMVLLTGWMLLGKVITQSLPGAETLILVAEMGFLLLSFRLLPEQCPLELKLLRQSAIWLFAAQALTNRLGWGIYNPLSMMLLTLGAAVLGLRIRREQMKRAFTVMMLIWCGILAMGSLCGILAVFAGKVIPGAVVESSGLTILGHSGEAFACCLATGAGVLLRQCASRRGWLWKVLTVVFLPLYLITLLVENSKAAFLAVAVVLALTLAELLQRLMRNKQVKNVPRIALTLLAAAVFGAAVTVGLCYGGNQMSGAAAGTTAAQQETELPEEELTEAKSASQTANKPAEEAETVTEAPAETATEAVTEAETEDTTEAPDEGATEAAAEMDFEFVTEPTRQTEEAVPAIAGVSQQEEDDFETELSQSRWNWYDIVDELRDYPQGLLFGLAEFSEEVPVHDQLLYLFWQGGVPLLLMMAAVLLLLVWRMVRVFFLADPEVSKRVRFTVAPLAGLLVLLCTMPLMEETFSFAWAVFALLLGWFIPASADYGISLPVSGQVESAPKAAYSPQRLQMQRSPMEVTEAPVMNEEPMDYYPEETGTEEMDVQDPVQEQEEPESLEVIEEGTEP